MDHQEIDTILRQTLEDRRLSRTEKRALKDVFSQLPLDRESRAHVRSRLFQVAGEVLTGAEAAATLDWAKDIINVLHDKPEPGGTVARAYFSPGDECRHAITGLLSDARASVDICVFTITDDRLTRAIVDAHRRGIKVRIVSDNDKAEDRGSDVDRLESTGVPLRVDRSEHHMHHKYAIFDGRILVTGSYNWTRSAAAHNRENIVVSDDDRLVAPFRESFRSLWDSLR